MSDNFTRIPLSDSYNVKSIITLFYMDIGKDFSYGGESHNFWELVYIDKGEMLCTAGKKQFSLKSGELTFHKPNEYHNLKGNTRSDSFVSILTFELEDSLDTEFFEGRIFRLDPEQRSLLSTLFREGIAALRKDSEHDPLTHGMSEREGAPFGYPQMIKNYLEIFLITLRRSRDVLSKESRTLFNIDGTVVPERIKKAFDYLTSHIYSRITVASLAAHLGVSESLIKQEFPRYLGSGIITCFNRMKAEEAKRLIRRGEHSLSEISDMLSFDTPQYFSHFFKLQTKMTPSEYKRSII